MSQSHLTVRQSLLFCGILSSLLYVAMNVFVPMRVEGYSVVSRTVSELAAVGAPMRPLWLWLSTVYVLLMIAFGVGVWLSARQNRPLLIMGGLLTVYGIISLAWPFAPMHQREVLAVGGGTLADTMHLVLGFATGLFYLLALGFGAAAFGKRFRLYSIVTMVMVIIFGALMGSDGPRMAANLPTPWVGVWERIMIGSFLLWIAVVAIMLLREEKGQGLIAISKA